MKEWQRFALDLNSMEMKLGEHPRQIFVEEMKKVGRPVIGKGIDIVLLREI